MKKFLLGIVFVLFAGIFVSCDGDGTEETTTRNYQYSDYSYYQVKAYDDQLEYSDGTFYVYYYSENCGACISIKSDVLGKVSHLESDVLLLFDVFNNGLDIESSFNIEQTPTLIKVTNNRFDEKYVGVSEILPILNELE